jgi:hypothetical protein
VSVARDTPRSGHVEAGAPVELGVNDQRLTDHRTDPQLPVRRPLRCLRHRVWLAACDDCRIAHSTARADSRGQGTGIDR